MSSTNPQRPNTRPTKPSPPADPFKAVFIDCIFAAQGLIYAGNGALMFMIPSKISIPGGPAPLDAAPEVVRAFGITQLVLGALYIQSVYQTNRGFMQGSILLRMLSAWVLWGNGLEWHLAALVEVALAFGSGVGLLVAGG